MDKATARPVANGLRTDHPIPDLPFVDDSHIPVEDRYAVEAVGRHEGTDMWGREDGCDDGGWTAFTTDPVRHDLAWSVRWHPEHGRSVVLYRDEDAASIHMQLQGPALLFRSGGYWWDGASWYRPPQIWDAAGDNYLRRPVPAAATVTAADLLQGGEDPDRAAVLRVEDVRLDPPQKAKRWSNDLALWAARRRGRSGDDAGSGDPAEGALARSVVGLTAPELSGDQLIGLAELAATGGVAPSTLRAYISRDESDVPAPQATVGGRSAWSRAVAAEWGEQRRSNDLDQLVGGDRPGADPPGTRGPAAPGLAEVHAWFARLFFDRLWRNPERRRRWALRARTESAVREVADGLALDVSANLRQIVRLGDLAITIRHAVLQDFRADQDNHAAIRGDSSTGPVFYAVSAPVGRMLGWLIRHDPQLAANAISLIVGEAERHLHIARGESAHAVRTSVHLDGGLDADRANAYLDQVLTPLLEGAAEPDPGPGWAQPVEDKQ